ncbi:putative ATPase of the PP-loop superfamily implicated in cell cycle control [Opitutaceae bacterium TAV1]|nr:putative ATPase of the PP-loop superfamily implicated in cell cycle control [Opitutaceae bacterium TAV1]
MSARTSSRNRWPAIAARLAAVLPRERLHPAVLAFAAAAETGEAGGAGARRERWAVAFSGGADSLALLLLLWAHWPERRGRLLALHFDHRLRGRASAADERFCRVVCASLGVEYAAGARDLPMTRRARDSQAGQGGARGDGGVNANEKVSEAAAREARMGFFTAQLSRRRIRCLFFGHQLDDIAETLFMRIARGSGAAGLAAPRPVQALPGIGGRRTGRVHLRPLLTLSKADLVAALSAAGATWREDASNGAGDFFRNRIRLDVLPRWLAAAHGRDALAGAALTRAQLDEDNAALEAWAARLSAPAADDRLPLAPLAGAPRAVLRRVLHGWLAALPTPTDLSRQGFDLLLDKVAAAQPTRFSLGKHGFAIIRQKHLAWQKAPARGQPRH